MSDIAELEETLDLDAALARTYLRYDQLRLLADQRRRRRRTIGGCIAAVAAAVAIVVPLVVGSEPPRSVHPPAGRPASTTTSDPNAEPQVPAGFERSVDGQIVTLKSTRQPPHDVSKAPGVEASSATTERARIVSSSHGPVLRSVTVRFNCVKLPEQIAEVSYTLTPTALLVQASLSYVPDARPCPSPDGGPVITLPLLAPLPAGIQVVAGSVPSH